MTAVSRAFAARVEVDAAAATSVEEIPGGVRLSTPELPTIWDLNTALLAPGADAVLIERTLYDLPEDTRRITAFDPADPIGPEDLSATICQALGINPKEEFHTPDGRPVAIVNGGKVISELF